MRAGDTVVVIGVGGIGTAAIQSARINGAAQIVAVDPLSSSRSRHCGSAQRTGADRPRRRWTWCSGLTYGVMADAVVVSPSLMGGAKYVRDEWH